MGKLTILFVDPLADRICDAIGLRDLVVSASLEMDTLTGRNARKKGVENIPPKQIW